MGGVTTVLDMPNTLPTTSTVAAVEQKRALAEAKLYCDVGLFGLLGQDSLAHLRPMAEAGVVGFKCFLGQSTGDIPPPDDGVLLEALSHTRDVGKRIAFHAENDAIVRTRTAAVKATGRTDAVAHTAARPVVAEVEAIQRVALLAHETGAKIHILHLSTREGLAMVEHWRAAAWTSRAKRRLFLSTDDVARAGSIARIIADSRARARRCSTTRARCGRMVTLCRARRNSTRMSGLLSVPLSRLAAAVPHRPAGAARLVG
jgi:dihydroorotase